MESNRAVGYNKNSESQETLCTAIIKGLGFKGLFFCRHRYALLIEAITVWDLPEVDLRQNLRQLIWEIIKRRTTWAYKYEQVNLVAILWDIKGLHMTPLQLMI